MCYHPLGKPRTEKPVTMAVKFATRSVESQPITQILTTFVEESKFTFKYNSIAASKDLTTEEYIMNQEEFELRDDAIQIFYTVRTREYYNSTR